MLEEVQAILTRRRLECQDDLDDQDKAQQEVVCHLRERASGLCDISVMRLSCYNGRELR